MENKELDKSLEEQKDLEEQEHQETDLEIQENTDEVLEEVDPVKPELESIVELSTEYNYRSQKFCQLYRMRIKGKSLLVNSIMIAVLVAISVIMYFMNPENLVMVILPLLIIISPLYNILCEEKRIDKFLVRYFSTHPKFTLNYLINEETIRFTQIVDGEEKWSDIPWAYVNEVHAVPEYYFLYLNGGNMFILDRSEEVMTKGTQKDLNMLIQKVTELKPLYIYNKPYCKNFVEVTYYEPTSSNNSVNQTTENNFEENNIANKEDNASDSEE